jgi:hypothetical protein
MPSGVNLAHYQELPSEDLPQELQGRLSQVALHIENENPTWNLIRAHAEVGIWIGNVLGAHEPRLQPQSALQSANNRNVTAENESPLARVAPHFPVVSPLSSNRPALNPALFRGSTVVHSSTAGESRVSRREFGSSQTRLSLRQPEGFALPSERAVGNTF